MMAATLLVPATVHTTAPHIEPPGPILVSAWNISTTPGGWPDTWVFQESR